jgi:hypothetical protein
MSGEAKQGAATEAGEEWIETEMWNFVHGAAINLGLPESAEKRLHHEMKVVITAHQNVRASHAAQGEVSGGTKVPK